MFPAKMSFMFIQWGPLLMKWHLSDDVGLFESVKLAAVYVCSAIRMYEVVRRGEL